MPTSTSVNVYVAESRLSVNENAISPSPIDAACAEICEVGGTCKNNKSITGRNAAVNMTPGSSPSFFSSPINPTTINVVFSMLLIVRHFV